MFEAKLNESVVQVFYVVANHGNALPEHDFLHSESFLFTFLAVVQRPYGTGVTVRSNLCDVQRHPAAVRELPFAHLAQGSRLGGCN